MPHGARPRAELLLVLGCVVLGIALFGLEAARGTGPYRSHVDFSMEVPLPAAHWDAALDDLPPREAIERSEALAESDGVQRAIADELDYDHTIDVGVVDDQTLRFTGEADDPSLAANAATAAAAIFGQIRGREAQEAATEVLPELQAAVASATGAAREDAVRRLHAAEDTIELGPAGGPVGEAPVPCCRGGKALLPAMVRGALLGALLGLAVVAAWRLDRRIVERRRPRSAPSGEGTSRRVAPGAWVGPAIVAALVGARSAYYALLGPRLILDDWLVTYRGRFSGLAHSVPEVTRIAQPTKWLWLTGIFALADERPLVLFALVTLVNLAAALALYYAVNRFFPAPVPLLVAGLWVLTANHSSLTVWAAASQAVVSVACCCLGITLLSKGRWLAALVAFSASTLAYEFTIPICFVASVLVGGPWLATRPDLPVVREVRRWQRAVLVVWLLGIVWWTARHPKYPVEWHPPSLWDTWSAHVSTGLVATESAPALLLRGLELAVAAGIVWCAVAWVRGDRARDRGPALVLAGTAVMALGLITTVVLPGLTIGLSNRLYGASSVGTAMVLAGIGLAVWHRRPAAGVGVAMAVVALCVAGQVVALRAAHRGGEDVLALLRHLPRVVADPANTSFLVAPRPEHDGFYAVDQFFGVYPFKLTYPDGDGNLRVAADQAEFERPEPGEVRVTWEEVLGRTP